MGSRFSPLADRMKAYEEVRRLMGEGVTSPSAVMKRLNASGIRAPARQTVDRWMLGRNAPTTSVNVFVPRPSPELSFFIGAWLGDGWADENDGGKRMLLKVRSYDFAKEFADSAGKILGKEGSYLPRKVTDDDGDWYKVKVTSLMLYAFATQPQELVLAKAEPSPKGFLRGFITAEGGPYVTVENAAPAYLSVGVAVSNSDRSLLEFTRRLLTGLGFEPGRVRLNVHKGHRTNLGVARKNGWLLSITSIDQVRRFFTEVGFADSKKQTKLDDALSLLAHYGRCEAVTHWRSMYEKSGRMWVRKSPTISSG